MQGGGLQNNLAAVCKSFNTHFRMVRKIGFLIFLEMYGNVSLGKGDCDWNLEKQKHEQRIAPGCVFFDFYGPNPLVSEFPFSDTIHNYPYTLW